MPSSASSEARFGLEAPLGRVLLIDDNLALRATTALTLQSYGFDVVEAESGEEAVVLYRPLAAAIDVVLLEMPGMDGLETYRELKILDPAVRAVMISGDGQTDRVDQALAEGAIAFVAKPFFIQALVAVISRSVDRGTDAAG